MKMGKAKVRHTRTSKKGKVFPAGKGVETRLIPQKHLTSECWMVQFRGLKACEECEFKDTSECGGKAIRKKLMNVKGYKVPLGAEEKDTMKGEISPVFEGEVINWEQNLKDAKKYGTGKKIFVGDLGEATISKNPKAIPVYYIREEDGSKSWQLNPDEVRGDVILKTAKVIPSEPLE